MGKAHWQGHRPMQPLRPVGWLGWYRLRTHPPTLRKSSRPRRVCMCVRVMPVCVCVLQSALHVCSNAFACCVTYVYCRAFCVWRVCVQMCRRLVHALCPHSCSTHLAVRICITGAHSLLCFQAKQLDDADEEVLQGIFAEATAVAPAPTAPPTADEQPPNMKAKREPQ